MGKKLKQRLYYQLANKNIIIKKLKMLEEL